MSNVLITGASSGLGKAISINMKANGHHISDWSLSTGVNLTKQTDIWTAAANRNKNNTVDILINCAGINEIAFIEDVEIDDWDQVMNTNARAIWLVTRALLKNKLLPNGGTILNIISNASHVPMTGSIAYNASKGAAEIMTKQMNRELIKTHNITVFGISPNKLAGTGMSNYIDKRVQELRGWTAEQAKTYQLAALPAGEETNVNTLAEFIAFLLNTKQRHKYLAGCIIPYGL